MGVTTLSNLSLKIMRLPQMLHCKNCNGQTADDEGFCEHCDALLQYTQDKATQTGFDFLRLIKWLAAISTLVAASGIIINLFTKPNFVPSALISFCFGFIGSICIEYCFFKIKGIEPHHLLDTIATGWARQLVETRRIAKGVERQLEKTNEETSELEQHLQRLSDIEHLKPIDLLIEKNELLLKRLEEVAECYKTYVEPRRYSLPPAPNGIEVIPHSNSPSISTGGTIAVIAANLLGELGSTLYASYRFERLEKKMDQIIG